MKEFKGIVIAIVFLVSVFFLLKLSTSGVELMGYKAHVVNSGDRVAKLIVKYNGSAVINEVGMVQAYDDYSVKNDGVELSVGEVVYIPVYDVD